MTRKPYDSGNRCALPDGIKGNHFFYRTKTPAYDPMDVALVVAAIRRILERRRLNPAEIEVFHPADFARWGESAAQDALPRLAAKLRVPDERTPLSVSLLVCEWASAHADGTFAGEAFVTSVLYTGPQPYLMQTFHTYVMGSSEETAFQDVRTSNRVLKAGDTVVFDPTTPHMAVPLRPGADQLLVLLQAGVPDHNPEDRAELLHRFPPCGNDADDHEVFNGQGY